MKRFILLSVFCICVLMIHAQQSFNGVFRSEELGINAELNLTDKSIPVPDIPDEKCYGYLSGNLNGTWAVMKIIDIGEAKAVVRLVSDLGYEAQTVELTQGEDKSIVIRLMKDKNMKAKKDGKYVSLPKSFVLLQLK